MVSIYLYKNLEESCVTLAATELQANFQIATNPNTAKRLKDLVDMENKAHIWTYCGIIFDKFKQIENAPAPNASPASTQMPSTASAPHSRTHGRRRVRPTTGDRTPKAAHFIASDK
jgi:hypothetical protein